MDHAGGSHAGVRLSDLIDGRVEEPKSASRKSNSLQRLVWRRPANSSNVRVAGAGHLIAQEKPQALGE